MPRTLVTGAAGFIGSHVAARLLHEGHDVVGLDDLSGGTLHNVPEGVRFVEGSVTDARRIELLFAAEQFDFVFHLAAYAAEGLSHFIRRFNYTNNVLGSVNLINESVRHHVRRFVFTSSMAVYGDAPVPMTEATPLLPADPYGIAKHCVELDLRAAHEMFGLDYTIFRPHNVYGPKQNIRDRYRNVIGIFMNQIMHDEPMTVFGDGLQTRAFSYIDDVAPLIARCIRVPDSENETFNIGADEPYSVMALANAVAAAMGTDPMVKHLPPRLEVRDAFTSHDKLRAVFGAQWSVPLDIGLKAMAEWARLRGPSKPTYFDRVELTEGLPAVWSV